MKIRDLITQDKATLSFEVFPPKKDTDFADVEAAALGIAALKPGYMSVTYGAGGSTKGHTIQLAREIQEKYDVPTIAHLTCVCASRDGIKNALVVMDRCLLSFRMHPSWWSSSRSRVTSVWAVPAILRYIRILQISMTT